MEEEVKKVIKYFSIFKYPPNFDEIYAFTSKKTSKKAVKMAILNLERHRGIKSIYKRPSDIYGGQRYTIGEYTTREYISLLSKKKKISRKKLENIRFRLCIKLISYLPQVRMVGISGSISMLNAQDKDDIDLFIVSSRKRLFTARFFSLMITQILGLRRKFGDRETKNKVCLNLFFDENNLKVPKYKQTIFVGHEVLQMKPIVDKDSTYHRFIKANDWVYGLFPNAEKDEPLNQPKRSMSSSLTGDMVERVLKYIQLKLINSHKTTELITDTQLWFHPDDFEKKLNGKNK